MQIAKRAAVSNALVLASLPLAAFADLGDIPNFREYSDSFASAGQPTEEQLAEVRDAGFERIVYIAMSNSGNALANEDGIVRDLGMDYIHIPVVWTNPTLGDFGLFASVMQQNTDKKTLLHCQVNFRASAFGFLYRVIHGGVPVAEAKADMNTVWEPNDTWREFIFDVLEENGVSPDCAGCQWEASD